MQGSEGAGVRALQVYSDLAKATHRLRRGLEVASIDHYALLSKHEVMAPNVAKVNANRQLYLATLPGTSAMRCCVCFLWEQSAPRQNLLIPFMRTITSESKFRVVSLVKSEV